MGKVAFALVAVLLLNSAAAQIPDPDEAPELGDVTGLLLNPATALLIPLLENETGQDLSSEQIDLDISLDIYNAEFEVVGMLFGGGSVQADVDARVHLEFRAVGMDRLDAAVQRATGDVNATVSGTFGIPAERLALTAEEIRLVGTGALLTMFQDYQSVATAALIERTVPGMTVLSTRFDWSNTLPAEWVEIRPNEFVPTDPDTFEQIIPFPDLREPPLVLDADARLQFVDRLALADFLDRAGSSEKPSAKKELKRELVRNETVPFAERTAFQVIGFGQLLAFDVPPGWKVDAQLSVPNGFTIEGATDELAVTQDHRSAGYFLDGQARTQAAESAGIVTLSSRFIVTATLLGVGLMVGFIVRIPLEMGILATNYRLARHYGMDLEHLSVKQRLLRHYAAWRKPRDEPKSGRRK